MKNNTNNTVKKKFNLSRKELIKQPLNIFKKISIEKLTKITSLSLKEKYKKFKEKTPKSNIKSKIILSDLVILIFLIII